MTTHPTPAPTLTRALAVEVALDTAALFGACVRFPAETAALVHESAFGRTDTVGDLDPHGEDGQVDRFGACVLLSSFEPGREAACWSFPTEQAAKQATLAVAPLLV